MFLKTTNEENQKHLSLRLSLAVPSHLTSAGFYFLPAKSSPNKGAASTQLGSFASLGNPLVSEEAVILYKIFFAGNLFGTSELLQLL